REQVAERAEGDVARGDGGVVDRARAAGGRDARKGDGDPGAPTGSRSDGTGLDVGAAGRETATANDGHAEASSLDGQNGSRAAERECRQTCPVNVRSGSEDGPRTRGGWTPAGTGAARRAAQDERGTARGQRTKDVLTESARQVFERDGYLNARVTDIVAGAGLA